MKDTKKQIPNIPVPYIRTLRTDVVSSKRNNARHALHALNRKRITEDVRLNFHVT